MVRVNWVVDQYILDSPSLIGDLIGAIRRHPHTALHMTKYVPLSDVQDYGPDEWVREPTVLYGTVGFIEKCNKQFTPGAFGKTTNMNCNVYYNQIPNDWLLNGDHVIVTFGYLKQFTNRLFNIFDTDRLFIRPVSGFKTFTGMVITTTNSEFELNASMQLTSVTAETMVIVAKARDLKGEFRFVIADRKVVTGSEYRWDNILDVRADYPEQCRDLAQKVADLQWQPDSAYTCDVALTEHGPKVIEINSFSCAGLYACDLNAVVDAITALAVKEWQGID